LLRGVKKKLGRGGGKGGEGTFLGEMGGVIEQKKQPLD